MAELILKQGVKVLLDDEDLPKIAKFKWRLHSNGYVSCNLRSGSNHQQTIYLHRIIMNAPPRKRIDHRDRDKLNNRKENLRFCTSTGNQGNSVRHKNNKTSQFKGVSFHKRVQKWTAQIHVKQDNRYVKKHLGCFETDILAAQAYNNAAKEYFGEFALLNPV
jgi:hypothetical protein